MILPDGYVHHPMPDDDENVARLPVQPVPMKRPGILHVFQGDVSVPAGETSTCLPQTERTCKTCGVVKVTVHEVGGGARREWRKSVTSEQVAREIFCEPAAP